MKVHELGNVTPGTAFFICGRIKNRDGEWAVQADISSISLRVDDETGNANIASASPNVEDVIFDELQVDGRWNDRLGYNFCYATVGSQIPNDKRSYLFKFRIVHADGTELFEYFRVKTLTPKYGVPA